MNTTWSREDCLERRKRKQQLPRPQQPPRTHLTISGCYLCRIYNFISEKWFPRITFKLTDIDWPSCINYIEFDYYDTVYNESVFIETLRAPLEETINFQIVNQNAPCDPDFAHFTRVYGATGDFSKGFWTPPSCLTTTSTTTTPSGSTTTTTVSDNRALYRAKSENWELKEQISDLRSGLLASVLSGLGLYHGGL